MLPYFSAALTKIVALQHAHGRFHPAQPTQKSQVMRVSVKICGGDELETRECSHRLLAGEIDRDWSYACILLLTSYV